MIGKTLLNRYNIEYELGRGGMGVVYEAYDTLLNRAVAIKFLNTSGIGTKGKARLLQEARAVAQLNHPNIVSVFDAGEADGSPFIVMEFVRGDTLRKVENSTLLDTLLLAQQICLALEHAHSNGIIHRDLKLENIVITNMQTLKLMDFGLARTTDNARLTEEGAIMGTLAYLAPELIEGKPASVQSDLYAFGVILYELLTGQAPFQGTANTLLAQHMQGKVTHPSEHNPGIPEWVDDLVLRLLSKRPEERPESAKEVVLILEQKFFSPATTDILSTSPKSMNNLPVQLTSFVGREKEIIELKKELDEHRLVTLTGSGGTGKTRLSLQVAADLLDHFEHGIWFIELAPLADPDLIPQTILSTIGISEQPNKSPIEILKEYLHEKKILIVLDNCEHLIEASAKVTNTLLNTAPNLKVLASSREALGVKGELSYPIPSLSLPDPKYLPAIEQLAQYEAVRLFIDRALLVTSHFVVDKDNLPFIAQICYRLDGIPLAVELAAARIKIMSVEQIFTRLDDRFRLLTGGARTALPRQQTLRALIDWSYDILTENERLLLRRLSIFAGSWSLEAAEEICVGQDDISSHGVLDLLTQLINKSLVIVIEHSQSGETRYRMLETIRQYARENFSETDEVQVIRNRHLFWVLDWVEKIEPELSGRNQAIRLKQVISELENIRSAIEWGFGSGQIETSIRVVIALELFWYSSHPYQESRQWVERGLTLREGLTKRTLARILFVAAWLAYRQNDQKTLILYSEESLSLARELNDKSLIADAICINSEVYYDNGQFVEWEQYREEARSIYQELGDEEKLFWYDSDNIVALIHQGEYFRADKILENHLNQIDETGDIFQYAWLQSNFGFSKILQGKLDQAIPLLKNSLPLFHKSGNIIFIGTCLKLFSGVANGRKNPIRAAKLFGASERLHESIGVSLDPGVQRIYESFLAQTKSMLDEITFKSAWVYGKTMTMDQAIEYALEEE